MSTASATAFSAWATFSVLFLVFLIHHLWCYDRFKCLRWSSGRQPATFKRVMTYSYLVTIPLLAFYSVGMTVIKYREGFTVLPSREIIPVPINDYRESNRSWILPLQFVFSFAWALEMVTHLEELAFWLYLLHQNPEKEEWFSSWEYRLWYIGSLVAIIGMPLTALITRRDLQTVDAYLFLVGSSGSTLTTITFLYVLWRFPTFIKHVKDEGADPTVVVRLATFYQLNQVRVVFRFLFTIPLLILAFDGIIGTQHTLNRNLLVADFLQVIAGLGCFVSSMITLLIFFPRSIVRESGYKPKLSSTLPNSPKSPPVTPSAAYAQFPPPHPQHVFPAHMAGYATPNMLRMSVTGGTGYATGMTGTTGASTWEMETSAYTQSVCSPRDSMMSDSPQYTAEDVGGAAGERRGSRRVSRRGSRRVSAFSVPPMDAHLEQDSDKEDQAVWVRERDVGYESGREDEERVPPYSSTQPHPLSHIPPHGPTDARLHQRHPFPHSVSSPQVLTVGSMPLQEPSSSPSPPGSNAPPPADSPPSPTSKLMTWNWEQRRAPALEHNAGQSLHIFASGPRGTAVGVGPGGVELGLNLNLQTALARGERRRSNLHPYVVNFTSPIDLVDLPPHEELPRSV